jgi:2'-5' RNA ligase
MLRLFVGLELPPLIRERLLGQMGGIPGARWQTDDQLHLTLRFIGNVEEHLANDIDLALQGVDFTPFTLGLDGTGLFGTLKKPRLVWAGVSPTAPLVALERKLEAALVRVGLPAETRKYSPHITLARLDRNANRIDRFLEASGDLTSQHWPVDHFTLFRSHLGHNGAHYEVLERYPPPDIDTI